MCNGTIQSSMEGTLACHPALSTEWLAGWQFLVYYDVCARSPILMGTYTPHTCIPGLVWQKQARPFSQFELKVSELGSPIHFVCVSVALYHRGVRGRHFPLRWIWPILKRTARSVYYKSASLTTTMRCPRHEFLAARNARCHRIPGGLPTLVPAPLWQTNNEDDDARYILTQYTYMTTSAPFLEICTSVLRLDVRFGVLALAMASSVEFRYKKVETVTSWHLWLDNTACPLRCKPISFLFGYIWIQDLMQSKECHHPIESEKSFPLIPNMARNDETTKNCGRSKTFSFAVLHHSCPSNLLYVNQLCRKAT